MWPASYIFFSFTPPLQQHLIRTHYHYTNALWDCMKLTQQDRNTIQLLFFRQICSYPAFDSSGPSFTKEDTRRTILNPSRKSLALRNPFTSSAWRRASASRPSGRAGSGPHPPLGRSAQPSDRLCRSPSSAHTRNLRWNVYILTVFGWSAVITAASEQKITKSESCSFSSTDNWAEYLQKLTVFNNLQLTRPVCHLKVCTETFTF